MIDISEHVRAICDALGADYDQLERLKIRPDGEVVVQVYLLDEAGERYTDEAVGIAATETTTYEART